MLRYNDVSNVYDRIEMARCIRNSQSLFLGKNDAIARLSLQEFPTRTLHRSHLYLYYAWRVFICADVEEIFVSQSSRVHVTINVQVWIKTRNESYRRNCNRIEE